MADDFLSLSFVYGLSANQQAVCYFEYLCDSCNLIYNVSWQWIDFTTMYFFTKVVAERYCCNKDWGFYTTLKPVCFQIRLFCSYVMLFTLIHQLPFVSVLKIFYRHAFELTKCLLIFLLQKHIVMILAFSLTRNLLFKIFSMVDAVLIWKKLKSQGIWLINLQ